MSTKSNKLIIISNYLIVIFCYLISCYHIWFELDLSLFDHTGHIASSDSFGRGLFHFFNDHFFLGYIQNLFYPPLGDLILYFVNKFTSSQIFAYRLYLSLVILLYFACLLNLAFSFKNNISAIFFIVTSSCLFFADKPGLVFYQGLSLTDLIIAGLSSQFLSASFLFLLIAELSGKQRAFFITLWTFFILISHLVVSLAAFIIIISYLLLGHAKKILLPSLLALALASFFWLPFIYYGNFLTTAKVIYVQPGIIFQFTIVAIILVLKFIKTSPALLAAFFCFLPLALSASLTFYKINLPAFHYHRLAILAVIFLMVGIAQLISKTSLSNLVKTILVVASLISFFFEFTSFKLILKNQRNLFVEEHETTKLEIPTNYGRYLVIDDRRGTGFATESLIFLNNNNFRSSKGLFWEVAKSNRLLSTYLINLLGGPTAVDAVTAKIDQNSYACVFDKLISTFNITGILIPSNLKNLPYLNEMQEHQLSNILDNKLSKHFLFTKKQIINSENNELTNYWITTKSNTEELQTNNIIEYVNPNIINLIDNNLDFSYGIEFFEVVKACLTNEAGTPTYLTKLNYQKLNDNFNSTKQNQLTTTIVKKFNKIREGVYKINLPNDDKYLFKIKLNFYPGWKLFDELQSELEIFPTNSGFLSIGSGELTLKYERTNIMILSYCLTIVTFLYCLINCWLKYKSWFLNMNKY